MSFLDQGGLTDILHIVDEVLKKSIKRPNDMECLHFSLLCLKALMNNKVGIKAVLNQDGALDIIALATDSPPLGDKTLVMEMLSLMCYVDKPNGHIRVLRGSLLFFFFFWRNCFSPSLFLIQQWTTTGTQRRRMPDSGA